MEAETAAQEVSPADEGMLGPVLKFSRSKCPSLRIQEYNPKTSCHAQCFDMSELDKYLKKKDDHIYQEQY